MCCNSIACIDDGPFKFIVTYLAIIKENLVLLRAIYNAFLIKHILNNHDTEEIEDTP